jgi:hypothetical protein
MLRIQEPVVLVWGQSRGHNEDAMFGFGHEFVSDAGKFSGRRGPPPGRWKIIDGDNLGWQIVGKFSGDQNQIGRRVARVEMNKIFKHGQGLVFGGVGETSSRARPAPTVKISTFTIQGRARKRFAQHAIDLPQKIGLKRLASTDAAVGDPSQQVFYLTGPQLRVHGADGSGTAQRAIGTL